MRSAQEKARRGFPAARNFIENHWDMIQKKQNVSLEDFIRVPKSDRGVFTGSL